MIAILKQAFPFAAIALVAVLLLAGNAALALLAFVVCVAAIPLVYAPDVEDIARATREGGFDA